MTPEQAKGAAPVVTGMWQGEVAATAQGLAAVKDCRVSNCSRCSTSWVS